MNKIDLKIKEILVKDILSKKRTIQSVSEEHGIHRVTVSRWLRAVRENGYIKPIGRPSSLSNLNQAELYNLLITTEENRKPSSVSLWTYEKINTYVKSHFSNISEETVRYYLRKWGVTYEKFHYYPDKVKRGISRLKKEGYSVFRCTSSLVKKDEYIFVARDNRKKGQLYFSVMKKVRDDDLFSELLDAFVKKLIKSVSYNKILLVIEGIKKRMLPDFYYKSIPNNKSIEYIYLEEHVGPKNNNSEIERKGNSQKKNQESFSIFLKKVKKEFSKKPYSIKENKSYFSLYKNFKRIVVVHKNIDYIKIEFHSVSKDSLVDKLEEKNHKNKKYYQIKIKEHEEFFILMKSIVFSV